MRGLAPAERKVVPPRVRGPLPPLLWVSGWNNPLRNFCVPPPRQRSRSSRAFSRFVLLSGTAEPGTCPSPLLHHVCLYSPSPSRSQSSSLPTLLCQNRKVITEKKKSKMKTTKTGPPLLTTGGPPPLKTPTKMTKMT